MPRRPFDILRAAFWLLAVIVVMEISATIAGGVMCWIVNFQVLQKPGACIEVGQLIRDYWSEALTAILALLLAGRNQGPPPPPPDDGT